VRFASTLSRRRDAGDAFAEAGDAVAERLGGAAPDLLLAFASPEHGPHLAELASAARRRFPSAELAGCTGLGVIGDGHEAEDGPALSLTGAALPGVALAPFHVELDSMPPPDAPESWRALVGVAPAAAPKLLLLVDPFTLDADALVAGLDRAYPGAPKFGGLASGGRRPGEHRLLLGGEVHRTGAVGVALSGDLAVDTLVAQGCRPIGKPMLVTRCHGQLLEELELRPPLEVLAELHASLDVRDRELMRTSLFLGLERHAERVEHEPGELLVRNLLGADQETGALVVGAELHPMTVVQFVLRDAHSAEEDLRRTLERARRAGPPAGALLFSCTGRGAGLFGHADHDTDLFERELGPAPLGGFFCNGEIGPVGGETFLHGYTSAFALFRARGAGT
jgi:small ligand-binding sensory domain FIST